MLLWESFMLKITFWEGNTVFPINVPGAHVLRVNVILPCEILTL